MRELVFEKQVRKLTANMLEVLFRDVELAIVELAPRCEGKTAKQISQIWGRKLAVIAQRNGIPVQSF